MKNFSKLALLAAALAVPATYAHATAITVDNSFTGTYGTLVAGSTITTAVDEVPSGFVASYTEQVFVGGTSTDVYCPTCLNFVITVTNTGTNHIDNITLGDFTDYLTPTVANVGSGDSVTTASNDLGTVNVILTDPLTAGNNTDTIVLFTNATQYSPGLLTFQDNGTAEGPGDVGYTPEPSSLMLLGTGLLSAGGMLMRRRRLIA